MWVVTNFICTYNLSTSLNKERNVHMNKKARISLAVTLIAGLSAIGANTYLINSKGDVKTPDIVTYSINSEILQDENRQLMESVILADVKPEIQEPKVVAAASNPTEIKDKQAVSRGGSGLDTVKPKVQTKLAAKPKTHSKPAAASVNVQANKERDLFYRLVSAEAGGESLEGQLAVATTIINRVKSSNFPNTITGVITDKNWGYQYTPVLDGRINIPPTESAKKAVDMVLNGHRSFGADVMWFVNPNKATSQWIMQNRHFYKTIGGHDFYN